MSYNEKFGLGLLVIVCLYMAGLNLWLLFKEWFNERYARKKTNNIEHDPNKRVAKVGMSKTTDVPSIIGKSKFNLEKEEQKRNRLEVEVKTLKGELEEIKKNQPIYSIPLEKENKVNNQPISSEDEIIRHSIYDKTDAELASKQSFTMDEFELMTKSLSGKTVTKQEAQQVAYIIPKMKGTDMYQQFIGQVKGAENRAMEILRMSEDDEFDNQSGMGNLSKFIRT